MSYADRYLRVESLFQNVNPEQGSIAVCDVVGLAVPGEGALVGLVPRLLAGQLLRLLVKPGLDDVGLVHQPLAQVLLALLMGERGRGWSTRLQCDSYV